MTQQATPMPVPYLSSSRARNKGHYRQLGVLRGGSAQRSLLFPEAKSSTAGAFGRIREHSLAQAPVLLIVGEREAKDGTVSLRRIGHNDNETLTLRDAMAQLDAEAFRSTSSPVNLPPFEGRGEDKEQLAQAAAG